MPRRDAPGLKGGASDPSRLSPQPGKSLLERVAYTLEARGWRYEPRNRWLRGRFKVTVRVHGNGWLSLNLYPSRNSTGNGFCNSVHVAPEDWFDKEHDPEPLTKTIDRLLKGIP